MKRSFSRRQFLKSSATLAAGANIVGATSSASAQTVNPIVAENAKPGSHGWALVGPALNREIEGFCSETSVNKGSPIRIYVSTPEPSFSFEVYRLGWYGGLGGRLMKQRVTLPGVLQPTPAPAPVTGLVSIAAGIKATRSTRAWVG